VLLALIELGTEIDYKDSNALTALSHAAIKGNTEIVSFPTDAGASLNSVDEAERTALSYASEMGHELIVRKYLNDPRTFPDIKDNCRRTPLWWAAEEGHEAVVRQLLEKGAAVDERWGSTNTTLTGRWDGT
jgi:ankyrin repeat protein